MVEIKPTISLVVPAFNEEKNLPLLFEKANTVLPKLFSEFEIIVVDDGSQDKTFKIVEDWAKKFPYIRLLRQPNNLGVGAALQLGFKNARYAWIFQAPADNQFDLAEIEKFLPYLEASDIVQGWRVNLKYSLRRKIVSFGYRLLLKTLFGIQLQDPTWVKMIRKDLAQSFIITTDGFFGEIEVLVRAKRLGCRISEVGVHTQARLYGESTASQLLRILKTCWELIRFCFILK